MTSQKFLSLCLCLLVASTAIVEARHQSFLGHIFGGGNRHQSRGIEFILAAGLLAKLLSHYRSGHHHHGHHHHGHHHHGHHIQGNALYQGHGLEEGRAANLGLVLPQEQLLQQAQAQAMQQLQVLQMAQARAVQQVKAMQYLPQSQQFLGQAQQFLPQSQQFLPQAQQLLSHQAQASQLLPEIQASQLFPEVQASELNLDVQASELLPLASEILPQALEQEFRQALQELQLQNIQL